MPVDCHIAGVLPTDIIDIGDVLVESGFRIIEVPLNSPEPLKSIELIASRFSGSGVVIGAGTVLDRTSVVQVEEAGGTLIIAPNYNPEVIAEALARNLVPVPGIATPTEALAALDAGAVALKLFPAEAASPAVLKAMRAILPQGTSILPVGGIKPDTMARWLAAGATGFGLGSALFTPGMSTGDVGTNAGKFIAAFAQSNDRR